MEHEQAIIAAMMYDAQCAERGLAECEAEDFANMDCVRVFRAMEGLKRAGTPIDLVTVDSMFEPEYLDKVLTISNAPFLAGNFQVYVDLLKEARKLREFRNGWMKCFELAESESPAVYQEAQELLDRVNCIGAGGVRTIAEVVEEAFIEMGERITGIPTGFYDLDRYIGGLVKGNLIVVAGRPSMGKSSFAVNVAQNVCESGKVAAIFSMEDEEKTIIRRMVCAKAQVSIAEVRDGDLQKIAKAMEAKERIKEYGLYVVDKGVQTAQSIASECYKVKQKAGRLDLVVVDYIGLVKPRERKNSTRQQELGEISRAMKVLAKDLNCTVMIVSQLNRGLESRNNKKPIMSDLRESGDIEQDADIILFPFRPWVYDRAKPQTEAEVLIAKNRNGVIGEIELVWRGEWFLFQNAVTGDIPAAWK